LEKEDGYLGEDLKNNHHGFYNKKVVYKLSSIFQILVLVLLYILLEDKFEYSIDSQYSGVLDYATHFCRTFNTRKRITQLLI
jgi:hypothetical protein